MEFPTINIQTSLQVGGFGGPFGGQSGPQGSYDFLAAFGPHHRHGGHGHHDSGQQGQPGGQLDQIGKSLVHTGEQLVQEGQQLIQQGDYQHGMQLIREGARLEQQGARLETQGGGEPGQGGSCQGPDQNGSPGNGPYGPQSPGNGQYGPQCPTGPYGSDNGGGYGQNCGGLSVNGNTVDTGRYLIQASKDNAGTLEVTDKQTGKSFKVWGDPHIATGDGDKADFQHQPATFKLPDGTTITVTPTNNPGVNTIDNVAITKGNDAATMAGFTSGNIQTQHLPGQGRALDAQTPDGTVLHARNGQIDDLQLPDGTEIKGDFGDIDRYASSNANSNDSSQLLAQLQQTIAQLEQQIVQLEQSLGATNLMTSGFAANPLMGMGIG